MLVSPLAIDATPFADVIDALRWAFHAVQYRGSGAWHGHYVAAVANAIPRPCEPIDVIKVCDTVIERYRLDHDAQNLIVQAAFGQLTPEQLHSTEWRSIEDRLTYFLRDKGIVQRQGDHG